MPSRSRLLESRAAVTIYPQSIGGAFNGATVDLQGAESATVHLTSGAATTPATCVIQESPDGATWNAVADSDLLLSTTGTNAGGLAQVANGVQRYAYVGSQRYLRVITTAGSAALFTSTVGLDHLRHAGGVPV